MSEHFKSAAVLHLPSGKHPAYAGLYVAPPHKEMLYQWVAHTRTRDESEREVHMMFAAKTQT
ncbi:MAG: hypothetical protein LBL23_00335, partial [Coriobacteriales bacterium]|nr:hypothetical protein [Coriobacteriales bacterium]